MPGLPGVQGFGVGQYPGMLGIHIDRCPAQIQESRLWSQLQDFITLLVIDGNSKKIAFAVGAQQGRGLNAVE